nr:MAG: hypothetical protein 1 [Barnaviridae sp.]
MTFLVVWPVVRVAVTFVDYLRRKLIDLGWACWEVCFFPLRYILVRVYFVPVTVLDYCWGALQSWWSSVDAVKSLNFITNGEFVYEAGKPCIRIVLDDVARYVDISPFLALHMSQRVGPESAIAGSMFMDVKEQPAGSFSLWNNDIFVGCGNRIMVSGRVYIVTAKHVFDALVEGCVYAQYKQRRAPLVLQPLVTPDGMDFVICRDNSILRFWGVKAQKTVNFSSTKVHVTGTPDGVNWKKAVGECTAGKPFRFTHTASTMPGYSGMLVRDAAGRALGLHTGSVKTKSGKIVNEGVAVVDFVNALMKHVSCRTMESYEEYDKPEWDESDDDRHFDRFDEVDEFSFQFEDTEYRMRSGQKSFTWKEWDPSKNWGDVDSEEEIDEDEEHFEEKAQPDFQMGLVTSATSSSVPLASQASSIEGNTLSKSQRKNRSRRLRKKATASWRTLEKATPPSRSVSTETVVLPTSTSLKPVILSGPIDQEKACSNPSLTTAPCSNKNEMSPLSKTNDELLKRLSQRFKRAGRVTTEMKVHYLATRQHEPKRPLTTQQQSEVKALVEFRKEFPTLFEEQYRVAKVSARSHAKSS